MQPDCYDVYYFRKVLPWENLNSFWKKAIFRFPWLLKVFRKEKALQWVVGGLCTRVAVINSVAGWTCRHTHIAEICPAGQKLWICLLPFFSQVILLSSMPFWHMYLSCFFFFYIYIIFSVCTVELSSSFSLAAYGDSEIVNSLKTGVISDSNVYVSWYHYETGHQTGFLLTLP